MRRQDDSEKKTPFDLIKEAVESGGYQYVLEREGDNLKMQVAMPRQRETTITTMLFGPDGSVVPPPEARELIERARAQGRQDVTPQEGFEATTYDIEAFGQCTDEEPCHGLQTLMSASCVEHGGIVGMIEKPDTKVPDYVGFVPTPDHRNGQMLVFNFCPCCGRDLRAGHAKLTQQVTIQ